MSEAKVVGVVLKNFFGKHTDPRLHAFVEEKQSDLRESIARAFNMSAERLYGVEVSQVAQNIGPGDSIPDHFVVFTDEGTAQEMQRQQPAQVDIRGLDFFRCEWGGG